MNKKVGIELISMNINAYWDYDVKNRLCVECEENINNRCKECKEKNRIYCKVSKTKCGHAYHQHCIKKMMRERRYKCKIDEEKIKIEEMDIERRE